jgi:hypothetical protein
MIFLDSTDPLSLSTLPESPLPTPFSTLQSSSSQRPTTASNKGGLSNYYGNAISMSEEVNKAIYRAQIGINTLTSTGPALLDLPQLKPFVVRYANQLFQHVEALESLIAIEGDDVEVDQKNRVNKGGSGQNIKDKEVFKSGIHHSFLNSSLVNIEQKNSGNKSDKNIKNMKNIKNIKNNELKLSLNDNIDLSDPIHIKQKNRLKYLISTLKSLPLYQEYKRLKDDPTPPHPNPFSPSSDLHNSLLPSTSPFSSLLSSLIADNIPTNPFPNEKIEYPKGYYSSETNSTKGLTNRVNSLHTRLYQGRNRKHQTNVSNLQYNTGRLSLQSNPLLPLPHLNSGGGNSNLIQNLLQSALSPNLGFRETPHLSAFYASDLGNAYTHQKHQMMQVSGDRSPVLTYSSPLYAENKMATEVRQTGQIHPLSLMLLPQTPEGYGLQAQARNIMKRGRKDWMVAQERLVKAMLNKRRDYLSMKSVYLPDDDDFMTLFAGAHVNEDTPGWLLGDGENGDNDENGENGEKNNQNDDNHDGKFRNLEESEKKRLQGYLYRINNNFGEDFEDKNNQNNAKKNNNKIGPIDPLNEHDILTPEELDDFVDLQIRQFQSDFSTYNSKETQKNQKNQKNNENNENIHDIDDIDDFSQKESTFDGFGGPDDIVSHILWDLGLHTEHDRTEHLKQYGTRPFFDVKYENEICEKFHQKLTSELNSQKITPEIYAAKSQKFLHKIKNLSPSQFTREYGRHNYNQTMSGFSSIHSNFPVIDEVVSIIHASLSSHQLLDPSIPTLQPLQDVTTFKSNTTEVLFPESSSTIPIEYSFVAMLSPLYQAYHMVQHLQHYSRDIASMLSLQSNAVETYRNKQLTPIGMDIVDDLDQDNGDVTNFGKSSEKIKKYSFQTSLKNHPLSYLNDLNHQNVTGNQFLEPSANQRLDDIMRVFDAMDELIQEQADYDQNNNPEWVFGTTYLVNIWRG